MAKNKKLKFATILLAAGKTATGIKIPDHIIEELGGGKKPLVKVSINGFTYRSAVAVMGGACMVGVNADNRAGANIKAGDKIEVTIEMDTEPRTVEIPKELQLVLNKNAAMKKKFETFSTTRKKSLTVPIFDAKTEETKQKRIIKAIEALA